MILIIDNYDSFVYNIYQYLFMLDQNVEIIRNDKLSLKDIEKLNPRSILISPGPCSPLEAGISVSTIKTFYKDIPILGVCLGHQSIGYAFGTEVRRAKNIMHGKTSMISHNSDGVFKGMKNPLKVMRYHSLVLDQKSVSDDFNITATSIDDNEIMAIQHKTYPLHGVQFHPESIMTPDGINILRNFLNDAEAFYS
ncbi:anthranilate/aminodeoxychorismate synthase component II [PVC group bacterium (ex Bugula neritina AB1)]|nr:anthranilate/aminodeoxychorismate synthase component II [PVC group bacterium (ex Bugula neritina AB1)]